jgi:hypothetical protein
LEATDNVYQAIENLVQDTWEASKVGHGQDAKGLEGYTQRFVSSHPEIKSLRNDSIKFVSFCSMEEENFIDFWENLFFKFRLKFLKCFDWSF